MSDLQRVLLMCVLLAASPVAAQTTRIVDDDGYGSAANCDDPGAAFATVGAAIAAAAAGDIVLVCPGTYLETINFGGKAIAVRSVAGPAATILDGNLADSVVTFESGEAASSSLEGFTITNGRSSFDTPGYGDGGGVRIEYASPVIRGNAIVGNRSCVGNGISIHFGSPLIEENTIAENFQAGCSSGLGGGGILILGASTAVIRRNIIRNNSGVSSGGGIDLFGADSPTIEFNVIVGNRAENEGGGIALRNEANPNIVGNLIAGNHAAHGGGIAWVVPSSTRGIRLVNNTIAANDSPDGSGIRAEGYDGNAALYNNIIAAAEGQTAVICSDLYDSGVPLFRSNDVFSAAGGTYGGVCGDQTGANGNISAAPLFVDPAAGDYHLGPGSPAIDAGQDAAPGLPGVDIDLHARMLDGDADTVARVDIGADEAATGGPSAAMPGAFSRIGPADGALEQPLTLALRWAASDGATSYEYCYDTVDNSVCDGTWVPAWNRTDATLNGLLGGTTYYWQVRALNAAGSTYADGGSVSYWTLTTSVPPITRIIALSGELAFGTQPVGSFTSRLLTIRNMGNAPLTIRSIDCPPGFSASWTGTIPAGELQTVYVSFQPTEAGTYEGAIVVAADHTGGTNTIAVSGTAISRVIVLSGDLAFGNVVIGTAATRTLTISNRGTDALTVYGISVPQGFSGSWSGTIPPGSSQDVSVSFAPTAIASYGGLVWVNANDTGGTRSLEASGAGILPQPVVTAHPANVTTVPGALATFSAAASGAAPVTVQWQRSLDGGATWSDIPGATVVPYSQTAQLSDSGTRFRAVFSNAYGSANTNAALLTVRGRARPGDFDGDGRAELAVWRPATGQWFMKLSSTGFAGYWVHAGGSAGDTPVPADYDADGREDIAVWRPSTGQWIVRLSSSGYQSESTRTWGVAGDVPVPADYDGDRRADLGIWRPSTGHWFIRLSSTDYSSYWVHSWGVDGDTPVAADFDGDSRAELGIWRPSSGCWYLLWSSSNYTSHGEAVWGIPGDMPLAADFDGDRRADIGIWRPATGEWFILWSSTNWLGYGVYVWGLADADDVPVPIDFDGDARAEIAVWRESAGMWFVRNSTSSYVTSWVDSWGMAGDVAVSAAR